MTARWITTSWFCIAGLLLGSVASEAITVQPPGYSVSLFRITNGFNDIEIDQAGNLYLSYAQSPGIRKLTAAGDSSLWSGARAVDLTLSPTGEGYAVAGDLCKCIQAIDSTGAYRILHQDSLGWTYVALTSDGTLYSSIWAGTRKGLYRIDRTTGEPSPVILGGPGAGGAGTYGGMASGADGKLYLFASPNFPTSQLFRLDGSQLVAVASPPHGGSALTRGPDGKFFALTAFDYGSGYPISEVWLVDPVSGESSLFAQSGSYFHNLHPGFGAFGYDPARQTLYVEESGVGIWGIKKIPPIVVTWGEGSVVSADTTMVIVQWPVQVNWPLNFYLERRTENGAFSAGYGMNRASNGHVSFADLTVKPGTRYAYRVGAQGDSGMVYSPVVWVDVPSLTPPPPPMEIWSDGTVGVDTASVTLDWPINPIITGDARVERRTSASIFGSVAAVHLTGDGHVRFVDTLVARGTSYVYRAGVPTDTGWVWSDSLTADIPAVSPPPPATIWSKGSVTVDTSSVALDWPIARSATGEVRVERRDVGGAFGWIGFVNLTGDGYVHMVDTSVAPGASYVYRAGLALDGVWDWSDELTADVPLVFTPSPTAYSLAFARGASLATQGSIHVDFTVPAPGAARIDAYDVHGRRVATSTIDAPRAGPYSTQLVSGAALKPGMYFLRLTLGSATAQSRAIVLGSR